MSGNIETRSGTGLIKALSMQSTTTGMTIDFKSLMAEFNYYESIDSVSTSIAIAMVDGAGLRNELPIIGGETINYSFSDSERNTTTIQGQMQLYKLANRVRLKPHVDSYDLFMSSFELMEDQYKRVSNAFDSTTVSDMAVKIFDDYILPVSGKGLMTLDETDGLFDTAFPRVSPFTAMKYLASEAKSSSNRSTSNYFFFENARGYHFASFQYLMRQPPTKIFYHFEDYLAGDRQFERNRVVALEEPVGFDILKGISYGQWGTNVLVLDPVAKRFRTSNYLYNRDFNQVDHLARNQRVSPEISQQLSSEISREKFIVSNSYQGSISYVAERDSDMQNTYRRRQEFLGKETGAKADILTHVTKVLVHGDSGICAGDTIEIRVPRSGDVPISQRRMDNFVGGKYLVTAVAHRIKAGGLAYGTVLECVKDSYIQPVDGRQ
jgi:hypothetical protein